MKEASPLPVNLQDLEVIGYADAISREDAPAIVPPVFRFREDKTRCLLPPYEIARGWLLEPQLVTTAEAKDLAAEQRITLPRGCRYPAMALQTLWLDPHGVLRYEPTAQVERKLDEYYHWEMAAASVALSKGKIDEAETHAENALAADEDKPEPCVILAVCHGIRGEEHEMILMREMCLESGLRETSFASLMAAWTGLLPSNIWKNVEITKTMALFQRIGGANAAQVSFLLTEEDYRRFLPLLHQFRRIGGEREITIVCGGFEAELLAEKDLLVSAFERVEKWVKKLPRVARHWTIAAEELLENPHGYIQSTRLGIEPIVALAQQIRLRAFPLK